MLIDGGPKRVALILDPSRNVSDEEWKLETQMAARLVEGGRPGDRFLLFIEGIDNEASSFLSPDEVDRQLRGLVFARPASVDSSERAYDALLNAAQRFDPPAFGDALILFGHPEDVGSKADPDQVLQVILKRALRFYGFSFRDPLGGYAKLDQLSHETGYYFSFHSLLSLNQPRQMSLYEGFLDDVYAGIAEPYRLTIRMPSSEGPTALTIEVVNAKDRIPRADDVHYPHSVYSCVASSLPATP